MKKVILCVAIISSTLFVGCKKEAKVNPTTQQAPVVAPENLLAKALNLSLIEDRLVFKTVEDYRKVVDNPVKEISDKFMQAVNNFPTFNSYGKAKIIKKMYNDKDKFNDPYFEAMLNSDQIIQIGDYLYRVNPVNKKVFVLDSKFISEYSDLVNEKTSNTNIKVYSTEEDVLDLVESNTPSTHKTSLFCSEGGIGDKNDDSDFTFNGLNRKAIAKFNASGIFFSLYADVGPLNATTDFKFDFNGSIGYIHYHVRCGSTADYGTISTGNANNNERQRYQSYQGSTNLNNMFFGFSIRDNSTNAVLTRMVVIRQNW